MPEPVLIPPPLSTPPGLLGNGTRVLPPELVRDASRRLRILSLVAACLWVLGPVSGHLARGLYAPDDPLWLDLSVADGIASLGALASLALFFYARWRERAPAHLLDLGLVYMVFTAVALGLMVHLGPSPANRSVEPVISWTGVVVLMCAGILPSTPIKTLAASLLAVSMNPLSMLVARATGSWNFGPASHALLMHYPDYLLVGVAVVISHAVTRLGQQVAKARELGSYQLGELIGRGGMGEVYRATHRMLARPAAIKLIRSETLAAHDRAAAELAVARFRREAEAAARLRSPHTVELYDFGLTDDGRLYFVMELLEGMDLESLVRQYGPMPAGRVIYLLRQVCESLEEAHACGLVHRDIKPANLHVGRVGLQYDFVKVLDFGLVKSFTATDMAQTLLATSQGQVLGTPAYLAPELALGEPADGRADLYALGCVAYYLLSGRQVFEARNPVALISQHVQATPVPPSERTELLVPEALDRVVLQCLSKRPHDRPRSAADLSRQLEAIETAPWDQGAAMEWWATHTPSVSAMPAPSESPSSEVTRVIG